MEYDLSRYLLAQQSDYPTALAEIKAGKKRSHWMWYIFPQIVGLGKSEISKQYAIQNLDEAKAFLEHPVLGKNLEEICCALMSLNSDHVTEIFGYPDDMKLRSSMTLLAYASNGNSVYSDVLEKFFKAQPDYKTLSILNVN